MIHKPSSRTHEQDEADTEAFLNEDGPITRSFKSTIPPSLLEGQPPVIQELLNSQSVSMKQNEHIIEEIAGLKLAHRTIHFNQEETRKMLEAKTKLDDNRFISIEKSAATFAGFIERVTDRKKLARNIFAAICLAFLLPACGQMFVEWIKHIQGWK